jgi:site-specific DNA-cytosine methylase
MVALVEGEETTGDVLVPELFSNTSNSTFITGIAGTIMASDSHRNYSNIVVHVSPDRVGTICTGWNSKHSTNNQEVRSGAVIVAPRPRRLMPIELERLQGFPDNWTEGQNDTQRVKQIGNAVTVNVVEDLLARVVAAFNETEEV